MTSEGSRDREFPQLVTHQILCYQNLDMPPAVMNQERVPDKFRHDRTGSGPGLDRLLDAFGIHSLYLPEQLLVDIRSFFL